MSALELRAVTRRFGPVEALVDVDLDVASGSRTAIVGPSGSGKTTLLRVIAGFETPDAGSVIHDGALIANAAAAVPAHRRSIGYVPQDGALFPHLSVADNVGFGLDLPPAARGTRVRELMDLVSLDAALLERWPHELSGGQQQRVALARALARRPSLMLLDEPFSALDTGLRAATRRAVARLLADARITTILVTHDQAEALSFADQVAVMRGGRLVQAGEPADVYWRPLDEATATFLGDAIVLPARIVSGRARTVLGCIAVDNHGRDDDARLMLRPEQIELRPIHDPRAFEAGTVAVVHAVDFGGPTCTVTIACVGSSPADPSGLLDVRCFSNEAPSIGARVAVTVKGRVHVLPRG